MELALPADFKKGPCCGVVAVAVVAGISQSKAEQLLRAEVPASHATGRRRRFTGGTNKDQRSRVLTKLGIKHHGFYPFVKLGMKTVNLTTYVTKWCAPGRTYMIITNRHVVTVRDGAVCDQSGVAPVWKHWTRKQHVRHVTEIL